MLMRYLIPVHLTIVVVIVVAQVPDGKKIEYERNIIEASGDCTQYATTGSMHPQFEQTFCSLSLSVLGTRVRQSNQQSLESINQSIILARAYDVVLRTPCFIDRGVRKRPA